MKYSKKIIFFAALFCSLPAHASIVSMPVSALKKLWTNEWTRKYLVWPALIAGIGTVAWKTSSWFFSNSMHMKLVRMETQLFNRRHALPPEAIKKMRAKLREVELSRKPFEFAELETFFCTVMRYPWGKVKTPQINLDIVKKTLDSCVFGMQEPKECVLDALFCYHQGFVTNFPPICLVGPPGVGKTAFATALAKALDLPQLIISAAGLDDPDSYFRGFSKTYKDSGPGFFVTMFTTCECTNPVIVIDEVDKQAKGNSKGTIQNVLLQILDPMQNKFFRDKFLDLPIDVSNPFYIITANDIENIIEPLQDRMLIINIPNYSKAEIETMAYGIIWNTIAGAKRIPPAVKAEMIKNVFNTVKKEPSIRTIKKNLSCQAIRWLRTNHKKDSMTW